MVPGEKRVGRISKPYGLQGQVMVNLDPFTGEGIQPDNPLFIDLDGQRVPFFVEEFDPVSPDQAIIKFEFLNSVEEARQVSGCEVYFDMSKKSGAPEGEGDYRIVIGYEAYDLEAGYLGKVTGYMDHGMNPVMIIDYRGRELLVPAATNLIAHINPLEKSIHFRLPEGLTSL